MKSHSGSYTVRNLIFNPPFLSANEISVRRFSEMRIKRGGKVIIKKVCNLNMNDRWWEWEEELGIRPSEIAIGIRLGLKDRECIDTAPKQIETHLHKRRDARKGAEKVTNRETKDIKRLTCAKCGHDWWPQESRLKTSEPRQCPKCRTFKWKGL